MVCEAKCNGVSFEPLPRPQRLDPGLRRLKVSDFHQDGDEATLRFHLKGGRVKEKGTPFAAAERFAEYIRAAGMGSGPLFRQQSAARSETHRPATRREISAASMKRVCRFSAGD